MIVFTFVNCLRCFKFLIIFFWSAALVGRDVSMQWTSPNGELLLPSRWNDLELEKNKSLDNTFQHAQLGALQQKPLLGRLQASRWGPYSPGPRPNILGCCGGPNRAQTTVKSRSQVPEKNLSDVFTLYFKCICNVITTYSYVLTMYQGCIMDISCQ